MNNKAPHIIISGGGTGGHVFPAISIAHALKNMNAEAKILFVGAKGKLEMKKVPEAGYRIIGLPVAGVQRRLTWKNLLVPFKLIRSLRQSGRIIKDFQPDVVVGVGGYASGPVLRVAQRKGIPALIQEQNSYAGVTNRLLAHKASKICVAYEGMEKYFPKEKIVLTGNPVREELIPDPDKKREALEHWHLSENIKTILVIGGSLGARSVNESIMTHLQDFEKKQVQMIWQCGKNYHDQAVRAMSPYSLPNIRLVDFIDRMDLAYAAADVIVSRAGAGTISELALVKKPVILVPSPNVAEDHQTSNARSLADRDAAILIPDEEAPYLLVQKAFEILEDEDKAQSLSKQIAEIAKPDSAGKIAEEVIKLAKS
ncbi:MAG: undecaprenyldiphospho-muramoylpentapeptide beta-N-acetylglucosaminyltransferase [Bacteroidales bacterium]|nr:undecaprenyldiphospho-muramoylpentapeptide beta-N-acetylglucosaminyltransferase [Bacteroidales bacterium]